MSSEGTFMRPYVAPPIVPVVQPDGKRFQAWRDGFGRRQLDRYALGFVDDIDSMAMDMRRLMRNARKAERRER